MVVAESNGKTPQRGALRRPSEVILKRAILSAWIVVMAVFSASGLAQAGETSVNLQLVSAGNLVSDGVYVGPYTAGVDATPEGSLTGVTIPIICDNYDKDVSIGIQWTAAGVSLSDEFNPDGTLKSTIPELKLIGSHNLSDTGVSNLQQYEAAAWLAQQITSVMTYAPNDSALVGDLNYAVWAIFSQNAYAQIETNAGLLANTSSAAYGSVNSLDLYNLALYTNTYSSPSEFSNVTFWIPTGPAVPGSDSSQEYMTVTPEPMSVVLFGTGLVGIGFALRKKRLA
jgi:hypothetical protein